ncbi:MAG TPA: family 1 glycosylhydrolase, partial [Chitinophagaceae bacterium]|nr:family 1 glycosylhydrolase [Chitinophagaceae bacterium]
TENGASFYDKIEDGEINDNERTLYLQQYLAQVLKAKNEGVNVTGYFVWSFTDNFEWAEGFYPRFGLVYIDFMSQRRIIKSSGHWYSQFLSDVMEKNQLLRG